MSPQRAESQLFRHIGTLCIAAVVAAIGLYLLCLAVGTSEAAQLEARAEQTISKVEQVKESRGLPPEVDANCLARVMTPFTDVPSPGRAPAWFAYKRPYVVRKALFQTPPVPRHFPPALSARADVGQVKLDWADSPQNQNIVTEKYELHRKQGAGRWQRVAQFPPGTKSYVDKVLGYEEDYIYKVISFARPVLGAAGFANGDDASKESEPLTARTLFNIKIIPGGGGMGRYNATMKLLKPDDKFEQDGYILSVGKKIVIKGTDTGWTVSNIGNGFVEITDGVKSKKFTRPPRR